MEEGTTRNADDSLDKISRLFLWANSGCNAHCRMCDIWRERPGRFLTAKQVDAMVPGWAKLGVVRVILCGEPLLHPEYVEICTAIRKRGIKLDFLTNGLLLERHASEVANSCEVLQVSLDGPPAVHNHTRGHSLAFDRLRRGVAKVHEISPGHPIDGRCAVHRLNFRSLREVVATARQLGLRSISFSATDLHNREAFRREQTLTPELARKLAIRGDDLAALDRELLSLEQENAGDFRSGFISDSPADLRRSLLAYYRGLAGLEPMPRPACNAPWTSAVLEYQGAVRPCFPLGVYGNVSDDKSLRDVVNSDAARALRSELDVTTDPTCLRCVCQTLITDRVEAQWLKAPKQAGWTSAVRT